MSRRRGLGFGYRVDRYGNSNIETNNKMRTGMRKAFWLSLLVAGIAGTAMLVTGVI